MEPFLGLEQEIETVLRREPTSGIAARDARLVLESPLLWEEMEPASDQDPETQDCLGGPQLEVITAEEVFYIFEEGLDIPANDKGIDKFLGL